MVAISVLSKSIHISISGVGQPYKGSPEILSAAIGARSSASAASATAAGIADEG